MNTFSITTAIAYVNGPPHIGHAFEFIQADSIARYHRLLGEEVHYLTGTDEHGSKIQNLADEKGVDVKTICDGNAQKFINFAKQFNISNDDFIRTSDQKKHWPSVTKLWSKLVEKGDIYKGTYEGLYCSGCEAYVTESDLVDGNCPNHNKPPQVLKEENYFFKLSKYSSQIAKLIRSKKLHIVPDFRANEILAFCDKGLEDVSFSRSKESLPWGVPVPNDPEQTMYVWCDALTNYISALDYAKEGPLYKKFWPADCHVIGKDILRFHAGIWIGMLISAEIPLPKSELIHGFVLDGQGKKMSKSLGNVIDPVEAGEHYGVDAVRYYLLSAIPYNDDGNFGYEIFETKINADLANNLGNFINRVLTIAEKYCESTCPTQLDDPGLNLELSVLTQLVDEYKGHFDAYDHTSASRSLIQLVDHGNDLISTHEPWNLAKAGETEKLNFLIRHLLNIVIHVAFLLEPFCPTKSSQILQSLGLTDQLSVGFEGLPLLIKKLSTVKKGEILFQRYEPENSLTLESEAPQSCKTPKSNLVIGQIISHQKHAKKDHVSICQVDIGTSIKNVVCAAANVTNNLKVIVALPGKELLDYHGTGQVAYTVEEQKTYGVVSEAVMVAPEEIGIKESDIEKQGWIVVVDSHIPVGTPFEEVE
jgi:methionyl-tRNA synthetase